MSWLFPAGAAAALALVAIVLLHMRHRLPEVLIFPQLTFWPRVPSETRESPRWRRPPLTLLFLLQLLAALLLVLAFMRPAIPGLDAFGGQRTGAVHHVIVLDGSTSMLARTSGGGTRWDASVAEAEDRLGDWQQGDGLTVIVASAQPVVRSAADSLQLDAAREWLDRLILPGGVPDGDALARLVREGDLPGLDRRVTLITDGGLDLSGDGVSVTRVGDGETENVAIVSAATTPLDDGGALIEATVLHDRAGTESIPWVARTADQELASGTVTLGEGGRDVIEVRAPSGAERVTLDLVVDDALPEDNRAVLLTGDSGLAGMRIVLVSDVPGPLQRALEVLPGATVEVHPSTTPGIRDIAASADLVVYEASAPAEGDVPAVPMLLVQPPGVAEAWQITGVSPDPALADVALDDAAMRDVSLDGVRFSETPIYVLPDDTRVLASGTEGDAEVPLIWRGTLGDQPYVAWAFDPATSNISDRVAFPLLVAQTAFSLARAGGDTAFAPGELVSLTVPPDAVAARVESPSGRVTRLEPHDASGRRVVTFPVAADPGLWGVTVEGAEGARLDRGAVVVNAGDVDESRLSSPATLEVALDASAATGDESGGPGDILTDIWPLLVAAAIGVIAVEWWIWLGRSMTGRRAAGGEAS